MVSDLSQYREVGVGKLGGTMVVDSSDPPNPFTDRDIAHVRPAQDAGDSVPDIGHRGCRLCGPSRAPEEELDLDTLEDLARVTRQGARSGVGYAAEDAVLHETRERRIVLRPW
jgi:hypothetical protein